MTKQEAIKSLSFSKDNQTIVFYSLTLGKTQFNFASFQDAKAFVSTLTVEVEIGLK